MIDYIVKPIPKEETKEWFLKRHYLHRLPCISFAFGLYDNLKLIGCASYGVPANPFLCCGICGEDKKDIVLELNRVIIEDTTPKNTESYFISRTLNLLPKPTIVVSYSDCGQGHNGYIYQACNFIFTGQSKERTDIATDQKHSRHYNKETVDYSKRQIRSAKNRYIFFCGDKKQKRDLLKILKYPILPYPKGDNKKYDTSATISPTQQILF